MTASFHVFSFLTCRCIKIKHLFLLLNLCFAKSYPFYLAILPSTNDFMQMMNNCMLWLDDLTPRVIHHVDLDTMCYHKFSIIIGQPFHGEPGFLSNFS